MLLKISITVFILCISLILHSFAKEGVEADLLVVAYEHHLLQYLENGENKGPTVEILNALLKEAQLHADVSFMPWARAFTQAKNTPNTLILSIVRTPEREANFYWLIKVSQLTLEFIALASKPENYVKTIEQAKKKSIAVVFNSIAHKDLLENGFSEKHNLYTVSSDEQMMNLFIHGRVDLIYADPLSIQHYFTTYNIEGVEVQHNKFIFNKQRYSYIAINKNTDSVIVKQLQQAADKIEKTAEYSRFFTK
ncbi:MAG: transporter substrate-binding domain-containing protein [Colwellia sp.]|nr:transporter substrate-binding domain-containing protein [Colwellia sp.]